jgi:acetyl-CoA synthetase
VVVRGGRAAALPGVSAALLVGDAARRDGDGNFWIIGRTDDVINVSGHRMSTAEVESAIIAHGLVAEAAVVGQADDLTGQAIVAFVTLTRDLPKTRSGKIMRRLLRDIAEGRELGDVTSVGDPSVVPRLQEQVAADGSTG